MPLSKSRMKERKRQDRLVKPSTPVSNLVKPKQDKLRELRELMASPVKPNAEDVKPNYDVTGLTTSPIEEESDSRVPWQSMGDVVKPRAPLYRRGYHKQGALVRMPGSNQEVTVPELDGEGNPVPGM